MSVILNWFDAWREIEFECPGASCGWKGKIAPEQLDDHLQYGSFECPRCDTCVALVQYPTAAEIKANWGKLGEDEKRHYGPRFELDAEFDAHHLERPEQLPDLCGDPLVLEWDLEPLPDGAPGGYTVIKHEGEPIWKERAYYECLGRFEQVLDILQRKYGERLKDLAPTPRSETYLLGDDLSGAEKLRKIRERISPRPLEQAQRPATGRPTPGRLRYEKEIAQHRLVAPEQLPDLDDAFVVFSYMIGATPPQLQPVILLEPDGGSECFDWNQDGDGFLYLSVLHEGRELWKEAAPPDDWNVKPFPCVARYREVVAILKQKYGSRLKAVVPTYHCDAYCYGKLEPEASDEFPETEDKDLDPALRAAIDRARLHGCIVTEKDYAFRSDLLASWNKRNSSG